MPHPLEGILGLKWHKKPIQPTDLLGHFGYAKCQKIDLHHQQRENDCPSV
ncbi:MAG: hypothetical protein ACJAX6_000487 [Limisphaerales bacterium]|jgi:hypothetical protein